MTKSKIVLLTVLIVLVLYCGAVIFVTKPNTNAYEGLFGSTDKVAEKTNEPSSEAASVDTDAILAQAEKQAEKIAAEKADAAQKSSAEYADAAIADAISKLVIPEAGETIVKEGDTIIQREEFDLEAHMPEIIDAVYAQLLNDKDEILDMIIDGLIEKLDSVEPLPEGDEDDYDTIRRRIREEESGRCLSSFTNNQSVRILVPPSGVLISQDPFSLSGCSII